MGLAVFGIPEKPPLKNPTLIKAQAVDMGIVMCN